MVAGKVYGGFERGRYRNGWSQNRNAIAVNRIAYMYVVSVTVLIGMYTYIVQCTYLYFYNAKFTYGKT